MKRSPLQRGHSSLRRSRLNPVSGKRRRVNGHRTRVVSAMREAAAGRCARCGRGDMPVYGHERLARAQGGDILNPDCLLCNVCNGWCEDNPQTAAYTGWKISNKYPQAPILDIGQAFSLDGAIVEFGVSSSVPDGGTE